MPFTTDLGTDIGKVRFFLGDLDSDNPIFSDEEVTFLLTAANNLVALAASATLYQLFFAVGIGWERIAGDKAKLAKRQKIAIISKDTVPTYESAVKESDRFYALALSALQSTPQAAATSLLISSNGTIRLNASGLVDPSTPLPVIW